MVRYFDVETGKPIQKPLKFSVDAFQKEHPDMSFTISSDGILSIEDDITPDAEIALKIERSRK